MVNIAMFLVTVINTGLLVYLIYELAPWQEIEEPEEQKKDPYEDYRNEKGLLTTKGIKEKRYGK